MSKSALCQFFEKEVGFPMLRRVPGDVEYDSAARQESANGFSILSLCSSDGIIKSSSSGVRWIVVKFTLHRSDSGKAELWVI